MTWQLLSKIALRLGPDNLAQNQKRGAEAAPFVRLECQSS